MAALPVGRSVTVAVPASTANLGPGFDAVGLGLGIQDRYAVEVVPQDAHLEVVLEGEGAGFLPADATHLVVRHLRSALEISGIGWLEGYGLRVTCANTIPMSAGLGSSAAAIVGGLMPLVAKKVGADPAVFSNPFISTFCDATGLIIYFTIATAVLGL